MYIVSQTIVSKNKIPGIYEYADLSARLSKNLYNAALFRIRQIFTGYDKEARTENEAKIFHLVSTLEEAYPSIHVKRVICYSHLEKLMRIEKNPDFFSGLPMQTAQQVLKEATSDFKNWLKALKAYRENPTLFLGKPRMPGYKRTDQTTFTITNQDAVLYPMENDKSSGMFLKLPLVKERLSLTHIPKTSKLKEVKVKPYYGRYIFSLTLESKEVPMQSEMPNFASVDFGIDNIAAIVCTDATSRLYKGGVVISENQRFAKERAKAVGILTKGHASKKAVSHHLDNLSFYHANFNKDQMHKISRSIVRFCLEHKVGTLVLGENKYWKQKTKIGKANNQKFASVPFSLLKSLIQYKASAAGINVIYQEESYTSKADFLAKDDIPVLGKNDENVFFSGKRICRGLYKSAAGEVINADLNGAANILRKAFPKAWDKTTDFSFLKQTEVFGFHELNPKGIPAKRITAA